MKNEDEFEYVYRKFGTLSTDDGRK